MKLENSEPGGFKFKIKDVIMMFSFVLFQAIWENQFYYLFGFLFLVFVILAICVSQISIVITYFQLVSEVGNSTGLLWGVVTIY